MPSVSDTAEPIINALFHMQAQYLHGHIEYVLGLLNEEHCLDIASGQRSIPLNIIYNIYAELLFPSIYYDVGRQFKDSVSVYGHTVLELFAHTTADGWKRKLLCIDIVYDVQRNRVLARSDV
jgi:hypothetical protein